MISRLLNTLYKLSGIQQPKYSKNVPVPQYNYYEIKYDTSFSQKIERVKVVKAILNTGMFKQKNHQTFANKKSFPWVSILIVETKDGNFAGSDHVNEFVTLIAIVCTDECYVEQEKYIPTFIQIAHQLNWKLYLTRDNDGNEDVEITS